jgi:hypothetical protein
MVTPGAKRDAVAHARNCHGLSERRACHLIGIARRVARYQPSRQDDTDLRQRLRELAAARRRFGYRRLGYLLAREGRKLNHKSNRCLASAIFLTLLFGCLCVAFHAATASRLASRQAQGSSDARLRLFTFPLTICSNTSVSQV